MNETQTQITEEVDSYIGFIVPKKDAVQLRAGGFHYDSENECLRGYLEDEEGDIHLYNYYPETFFWDEVFMEPDDFTGATWGDR